MVGEKGDRRFGPAEGLHFRRVYSAYGSRGRLLGKLIDLPPFDPAAANRSLRRGGIDLAQLAELEVLRDPRVRAARELGQRYPFLVEYIQDGLLQTTDTSASGVKPYESPYSTRVFINPLAVARTPQQIEDMERRFGFEPLVEDFSVIKAVIIGRTWGLYRIGAEDHVGVIKVPELPIMPRVSEKRSESLQTAIDYI
jgi:hypothetical protein